MNLDYTLEDFSSLNGVNITEVEDIFDNVHIHVEEAKTAMQLAVGMVADIDVDEDTQSIATRYLVFKSFLIAMPSLDLILTNTGFGIVSNNTLAPASHERVEALRQQLTENSERSLSALRDALHRNETWITIFGGRHAIAMTFDLCRYVKDGSAETFLDRYQQFIQARRAIDTVIGVHQRMSFFSKSARSLLSTVDEVDQWLISCLQDVEGAYLTESDPSESLKELNRLIEANAERYPLYLESAEYQAKHMEQFENKKENHTFWL